MSKKLLSFLRVFISLSLIIILLYIMRNNYHQIIKVLEGTNLMIFSLAFLTFLAAVAVCSMRLLYLIKCQHVKITYLEALSFSFIGYFFNNFLPTAIGGDVAKGYYLTKKTNGAASAVSAIIMDRIVGFTTMVFMAFVAVLLAGDKIQDRSVKFIVYIITAGSIFAVLLVSSKTVAKKFLFFLKPFEDKLKSLYEAMRQYHDSKGLLVKSFLISVVSQSVFFLGLGLCALSVGANITFIDVLVRIPVISILSLLPSINGLGIREGSTVLWFGPLIGKEAAFAVSILWLAVLLITSVIGGAIYAMSPQFRLDRLEKRRKR